MKEFTSHNYTAALTASLLFKYSQKFSRHKLCHLCDVFCVSALFITSVYCDCMQGTGVASVEPGSNNWYNQTTE
jgi:hypothetical protein